MDILDLASNVQHIFSLFFAVYNQYDKKYFYQDIYYLQK